MSYDINASVTGTGLATLAPDAVRHLWQQGIDTFEQTHDFFAEMEGGPEALIWEKPTSPRGRARRSPSRWDRPLR